MVNDHPPSAIEGAPMTMVPKLDHRDLLVADAHRSLAPDMSALNALSPNSASISSTTPSSMAELFGSPGLGNEDGGDSTSAVSTTAGRYDQECPLDCGHVSSASNIPSPIIEVGPSMSTNKGDVDPISEDVDLDVKPSLDEACFSDACCQQGSSSDNMFMSHLDELLQTDTPQEFAPESGLPCVDDLFPSLNDMGQDFSLVDGMSTWPMESLQSFEALMLPEGEIVQAEPASFGGEESASQMFTQWLQNNSHWISLSDLRKIKLKTSTIENAVRRLGGGQKGLMAFLKFVLMWVQNSQTKGAVLTELMPASVEMQSRASPAAGTPAVFREGIPMRDGLSALESSCAIHTSGVHAHTLSGCSSSLPRITVNSSCPDWTTGAQWIQPPGMEHNVSIPTSNRFSPVTSGMKGSPLPRSTFGCPSREWPLHGNMLHGVPPSSIPHSLRSPTNGCNGCIGGGGIGNPTSTIMLAQQECYEANPAATTRAARKSRMERQRWSVRRNRKWSMAAHQNHQHLAAESSNGGVCATLPARSQVTGSPLPSLPSTGTRAYQQRPSSRSMVMECQQNKILERNMRLLFHKQLKQSDVGNLGRIVLPKKAAETFLPPLDLRDGMNLVVEDMNSAKFWNMRYRFWPNNKSRMYLLENTGDFVKSYDLKEGDYMMLFGDNVTGRFVIKGVKGPRQAAMLSVAAGEDISDAGVVFNGAKKRRSSSKEEEDLVLMGLTNSEESCDDSLLVELIEQSLESSETEMCDPLRGH